MTGDADMQTAKAAGKAVSASPPLTGDASPDGPGDPGGAPGPVREGPLSRVAGAIMSAANVAATLWILFLMVLIVADVAGRNLFLSPIAGVPEIVKYSILGIVFLQVAHTHRHGEMIRSDAILGVLTLARPRLGAALDMICQAAGVAMSLVLAWSVWPKAVRAFDRGEMEGVVGHFQIAVWPFLGLIALGSALLAVSFALSAVAAARRMAARG